MDYSPPWDFPNKSTGVGCHFFLQRIFLTQGSNPGLPHCRQTLYHLSHKGSSSSIPGLGRSSGEGNSYPLQCSCLENSMDRGAWRAIVLRVAKNRMRLNDFHFQVFLFFVFSNFTEKLHTEIFLRCGKNCLIFHYFCLCVISSFLHRY